MLLILCDQLRKDCLGCYGNPSVKTPNIDKIAKNAMMFHRNYVVNPICSPNRMSIYSGMYSSNHGLWTNGILLEESDKTITSFLSEQGVQTASIGKIHFEPVEAGESSGSRESSELWNKNDTMNCFHGPYWGFDYMELHNVHGGLGNHMTKWFYANGGTDEMLKVAFSGNDSMAGTHKIPKNLTASAFVGDRTVNYLKNVRDKEQSFFLTASFTDPHHPFYAGEENTYKSTNHPLKTPIGTVEDLEIRPSHYKEMAQGKWSRKGSVEKNGHGCLTEIEKENRVVNTYAMIETIDENIGKILEELENQGIVEETAIIFTSDHGELLGDHGLWTKGPFYFEGLMSTPLLISTPDGEKGETQALMSSIDLAPTICQFFGEEIPLWVDGVSCCDLLNGTAKEMRETCMVEYRNGFGKSDMASKCIINQRYKYVLFENGEEELTDLIADKDEKTNLAMEKAFAPMVAEMSHLLLRHILSSQSKKENQISFA